MVFQLFGVPTAECREFDTGAEKGPSAIRKVGELDFEDITLREVENTAKKVLSEGQKPLFVGGDHAISLPACKAISGNFTFVVFDAHPDLYDDYKGRFTHATVTRRIAELPNCKAVWIVGSRVMEKEEKTFLDSTDKIKFTNDPNVPEGNNYVSVDIDVLDPSEAPGVDHPEKSGWSKERLLVALQHLNTEGLIGADIVEMVPDGKSELAAVKIIKTFLS